METSPDDPFPQLLIAIFAAFSTSSFWISGLALLCLLAISGLVSGSEVAFFSLSTDELDQLKDSDEKRDQRAYNLMKDPRRLLATILIVNNLVNILIVTISTVAALEFVGYENEGGTVFIVLTAVITIVIIFFGEIIPKVYATNRGLEFAQLVTPMLFVSSKIFKPVAWFLMSISDLIERKIEKKGYNLSVDEMNQALEITDEKEISQEEKGILKGIVNFGTLSVKQVMKSRVDIMALDIETDFHDLMDQINKTGYSRIPIYNESVDKIEGILYIKDLLPHLDKEEDFKWQTLMRPGYFVPESKKIDDLFRDFQEKQVHMAIVVDEYGGTEGLITLEDIIEEIVGEINDEFDEESDITYNKLDQNTYVFEGKTSLNDVCKVISVDSDMFDEVKGESESLGGLILELNRKLPNAGEKIVYNHFHFTVVAVDQKRIKRVRVFIERQGL
ncbi:MAG: gliding motility-associated protein GldE [Cytophagales bacterium]|nr:gliding motility-associated protein GldE [Cytophagales bacterium]